MHSFCSSGLMAVSNIANQIRNGEIEVGLAVGFESMSATFVFSSLHSSSLSDVADEELPNEQP
jgi:acetyl-CoA acetyltransferase